MTIQPPTGYLGTDGRISSGPAPELVAAGYALEISDAPALHDGLLIADLAHVIGLLDSGLIDTDIAGRLLRALLDMGDIPAEDFPYDVTLGDAYNSRERELERRIGTMSGVIHLGRTRREAGRIAFRLALRERLEALALAVARLTRTLGDRAEDWSDTVWADVTYLQLAQPSTFGHYLAAFAEDSARHLPRLRAAHGWADVSPAGSGGVAGTRMGMDRQGLAQILGFTTVGRNTRDTMWTIDGLLDAMAAATQTAITCSRLAEDLQIFASAGFGIVTVDASLCRASVLMPQKRNPYALSVIRAGASTLIGRLTGTASTARTPSAATDNWLHSYGEVLSSLELSTRLVDLTDAVVRTLSIDSERMLVSAADQQAIATDLADELVLTTGMDYRSAYRVVGRAVAAALESGSIISPESLDAACREVTGDALPNSSEAINWASLRDPRQLVATRTETGGCGRDSLAAELASLRDIVDEQQGWFEARRAHEQECLGALRTRANNLATPSI